MKIHLTLLITILLFSFTGSAFAGSSLTAKSAENFVASLDDVTELGKAMEKEGKNSFFEKDPVPMTGEKFSRFSKHLSAMASAYPTDHKKFAKIVKDHGFNSPESWAATGDDVMLAYIAGKIPPSAGKGMPKISPEMASQMPPEALTKMKAAFAMMEAARNVPQAHKDIVAPLVPKIDEWTAANAE